MTFQPQDVKTPLETRLGLLEPAQHQSGLDIDQLAAPPVGGPEHQGIDTPIASDHGIATENHARQLPVVRPANASSSQ